MMKWLVASMAAMLALTITQPSLAESDNKSKDSLSDYTEQLIDLMGLWNKLNQAVADRMQQNERYLLAKEMLRMSSGFYALKIGKDSFVASIEAIPSNGTIDYKTYLPAEQQLENAVECFLKQLDSEGARLGVLTGIDGHEIETNLRKGLEQKVGSLHEVARDLGVVPTGEDVDALKALLIKDGNSAVAAADYLQQKSASFAYLLDPSAVLSEQSPCGGPPTK